MFPPIGAPLPTLAAKIPDGVDGVALVPSFDFIDWSGFVKAYSRRRPDVSRHIVLGPQMLDLPRNRAHMARVAEGAVVAGSEPYVSTNAWVRLREQFAHRFPGVIPPRSVPAEFPLGLAYRNASEAVLRALENVDGELSGGERRFMTALGRLRLDTPTGRIRLDSNRQAVASAYLTRVGVDARGRASLRTLRVLPNVEQTFGGYFRAADQPPSTTSPACRRATPPPWAR
jgi:hypothetical protein